MSVIHRSWLGMPVWSFSVPIAAFAVLVLAWALPLGWMLLPLIAVALIGAVLVGIPLELGLPHKETALLAVTLLLSTITLAGGSSTVLHGAVHLVVFGAFLVVEIVP